MSSRDTNGERLASNRLQRDEDTGSTYPDAISYPLLGDHTVKSIQLSYPNMCAWYNPSNPEQPTLNHCPSWMHPGGMQVVGNILFVPVERPYGTLTACPDCEHGILLVDVK